jgi:multiple sugar transport system substrate-binding protein
MRRFLLLFLIFLLVGCTTPTPEGETPTPEPPTPIPTLVPVPTDETDRPSDGPVTLKIWVPPQFDPTNGSPEGAILQARLDEFTQRRPGVKIETRVKAVEGPGGMIDTLSTAGAAAPLAIPDLVAFPQPALENAAIKGLLHPYDGLTGTMDDPDWYDFARQLSHLQNSTFGIPFVGDALVMVYRPSAISVPPSNWAAALEITEPVAFPASDPNGLVTLAFYLSTGAAILDEENRPVLEPIQFTEVLTFYHQAALTSLMPYWLTQFETDGQAWSAYREGQGQMVISWVSRYLQDPSEDSAVASIPTFDGIPSTLATGWAWALTSPEPGQQILSAELAEFLTTGEFLAEWTKAAGYLPPRPSAFTGWPDDLVPVVLGQIGSSARLLPLQEVLTPLGPVLQKATVDILKEETDPATAAAAAVEKLINP